MDVVTAAPGHVDHDIAWSVVSLSTPEPVCIACLIQQLEDTSIPSIQKRLILSVFTNILKEREDIALLFRKNLLVARHLLDILTDCDLTDISVTVSVCQVLMEKMECEELVLYLLDKTEWQVENMCEEKKILACLLLIGQLVSLSPVYSSILLQTHGQLVENLVFLLSSVVESLQCCIVFIMVHVFEPALISYIPVQLKQALVTQTVQLLNTAHDLELQINILALLKKLLKNIETSSMIQNDSNERKSLVNGLKKLYVTKQEVLQTAGTQCIVSLLSTCQTDQPIHDILDSDLTEFLFECLHTQSATQIECVMNCLLKLTEYDLFFTRCHAVYGTESVLLALDALQAMKHIKLIEKGLNLLASFLERQPSNIPLFVNTSTISTCVSKIQKGVQQHHKPIAIQAFRCTAAFFREDYLPPSYVYTALETLLKDISHRMSQIKLDRFTKKSTCDNKNRNEEEELMILFITVISAAARLLDVNIINCNIPCSSQDTSSTATSDTTPSIYTLFLQITVDLILPYIMILYERSEDIRLILEHCDILLTVFKLNLPDIQPLTVKLVSCGWLIKLLSIKTQIKYSGEMMRDSDRVSILLVLAFKQLLQYETMPEWLVVGLKQLELPEVVNEFNLDDLTKSAETSSALLIVLYYSYLNDYVMWSPVLLMRYLEIFTTNHTDLKTLPIQCIKCLVLLLAWVSTSSEISYSNSCCTRRLLDILRSSSITNWYTHHPWILNWAFTDIQITECCGARILELWLPTLVEEIEQDEENVGGGETENSLLHIPIILKYQGTSTVLISLMGSENKEISDSSKNIVHWIINKNEEYEESRIDTMTKHSTDLLHQLFRREQYPQDHQIINVLGVLTKLLDNPKQNDTITRGVVPTLYHIIKMIGQEEDIENDITSVSLQYILTILHHKTDLGHLGVTVAPMLTQSTEFMSKLEECIKCKLWKIKNKSLHIITWLAMSPQHINVTSVIRIKMSYIIELISTCPTWCIIPALRLLTIALSTPVKNTPVVFYKESCIVEEALLTKHEIRHIYMYMQQFMCQDDIEILEHCTDSLKTIFSFCKTCNNGLDKELLNHPWNQHLIDTLIEINYGHGVKDAVLDILILVGDNKVCLSEDILTLWLHSILDTTLTPHKSHLLQQLLAKVKKEGVDSQLLTDVKQHLLNVME